MRDESHRSNNHFPARPDDTVTYYFDNIGCIPVTMLTNQFVDRKLPRWLACILANFLKAAIYLGLVGRPIYGFGGPGTNREISKADLPAKAIARFAPFCEQFVDLGFTPIQFSQSANIGQRSSWTQFFLSREGTSIALLIWIQQPGLDDSNAVSIEINTFCHDTTEIATILTTRQNMNSADLFHFEFVDLKFFSITRQLAVAFEDHQRRIANKVAYHFPNDGTDVAEFARLYHRRFEALLKRGIIKPLSAGQIADIHRAEPRNFD